MKAVEVLTPALERHELDAEGHAVLSELLGQFPEGQDGSLVEAFAARALEPQHPSRWVTWARVLARAQRYPEARAALKEALERTPGRREPVIERLLDTLPAASTP
jgi:hypothetical protein